MIQVVISRVNSRNPNLGGTSHTEPQLWLHKIGDLLEDKMKIWWNLSSKWCCLTWLVHSDMKYAVDGLCGISLPRGSWHVSYACQFLCLVWWKREFWGCDSCPKNCGCRIKFPKVVFCVTCSSKIGCSLIFTLFSMLCYSDY